MKVKLLDMSDCKDITKYKFFCKNINEEDFCGRVCILKFEEVKKKWRVVNNTSILDNGYIWLEFYPYNCNYCYTAMYNNENNIIECYIDITKKIKKENDKYVEDLFIDLVLLPNGDFFILDEDELEEAYLKREIDELDYNTAIKTKNELVQSLKDINMRKFLNFTNKYKEEFMEYIK